MKTKWLGILFTAAALALAPLSATAENRLPGKFVGDWCEVNHDTGGQNFTRGRCRQEGKINRNGSAITFHVGPLGYQYEGTPCKLLGDRREQKGKLSHDLHMRRVRYHI